MKKLIGMTDFVVEQMQGKVLYHNLESVFKYANFLKQPLELWMFIPCDSDGDVLDLPKNNGNPLDIRYNMSLCEKYQQAKERCLFEGNITSLKQRHYYIIYLDESAIYLSWNKSKKIEDIISFDLQLTQTAIKQLWL